MGQGLSARLTWRGGERFDCDLGDAALTLDGEDAAEASPMQALLAALGGCMAIDVAMILEKGRVELRGLEVEVEAERAAEPPRRFVAYALHFHVHGEVAAAKVERAVELSRQTYCSVWHSLAHDAPLEARFTIHAGGASGE